MQAVKGAMRQTGCPKDDYFDVRRRDRLSKCFAYGWSLAFSPTKKERVGRVQENTQVYRPRA